MVHDHIVTANRILTKRAVNAFIIVWEGEVSYLHSSQRIYTHTQSIAALNLAKVARVWFTASLGCS